MRNQTRREALKSGAALAAISAVGFPRVVQSSETDPLEELEKEFHSNEILEAQADKCADEIASTLSFEILHPRVVYGYALTGGSREPLYAYSEAEVTHYIETRIEHAETVFGDKSIRAKLQEVCRRQISELGENQARASRIQKEVGLTQAREKTSLLTARVDELITRMIDSPSVNLRGLAAKLRIARHIDEWNIAPELFDSAIADVERLSARNVS